MASKTDVFNRALTKLGDARVIDPTDDSEAAIVINNMFDIVRDAELRKRNWNFSIKRDSLAALVSTPVFGYSYEYQLPGDCLRPIMIGETYVGYSLANYRTMPEEVYQIEGRKILTNYAAPLPIRYVRSVTNVGDWDPLFVEYFAAVLAFEACARLNGSKGDKEQLRQDKRDALMDAIRADSVENPSDLIADDAWIMSRL